MTTENSMERLTVHRPVEIRSAGGNGRVIGGYALVFDRQSQNLGGYVERIDPRFLNKSRGDHWPGVMCRWNHSDQFLLGTVQSGTLRLNIDTVGLDYTVDLPECRSDVLELVSRGDIAHSSFAFVAYEEDWSTSQRGAPLRTLLSGRLIDVAPVTTPAYSDTSVALKSLARHLGVPFEEVRKLSMENELRKLVARTDRPSRARAITPREAQARSLAKAPLSLAEARARLAARAPLSPAELKARLDARALITARRIQLHEQRMRWA
jgi:HK97 family phage prohead protease